MAKVSHWCRLVPSCVSTQGGLFPSRPTWRRHIFLALGQCWCRRLARSATHRQNMREIFRYDGVRGHVLPGVARAKPLLVAW